MPSPISQKQFNLIAREIRETSRAQKYNAVKIAKHFNVSRSTVGTIKRVKTWNGFLALKAARHTSPKVTEAEKQVIENASEDQFAAELKKIELQYATKNELKTSVATAERHAQWGNSDAIKLGVSAKLRANISLVVSVISLVTSVTALVIALVK